MQVLENKATPPRMPFSQINHNLPEPVMPERRILQLLKGQKALVTGASSGIGKAIACGPSHVNYAASDKEAWNAHDEKHRAGSRPAIASGVQAASRPERFRTPINMQAWDTPEHYAELLKLIPVTSASVKLKRSGRASMSDSRLASKLRLCSWHSRCCLSMASA